MPSNASHALTDFNIHICLQHAAPRRCQESTNSQSSEQCLDRSGSMYSDYRYIDVKPIYDAVHLKRDL